MADASAGEAEVRRNSVFRELDRMGTELRHERRLREIAMETARRSLRDRERMVAQLCEVITVLSEEAVEGCSTPTVAVNRVVSALEALAVDVHKSSVSLAGSLAACTSPRERAQASLTGGSSSSGEPPPREAPAKAPSLREKPARGSAGEPAPVAQLQAGDGSFGLTYVHPALITGSALIRGGGHGRMPAMTASVIGSGVWEQNTAACQACNRQFTVVKRRHHCRQCGACVCHSCSPFRVHLNAPIEKQGILEQKLDGKAHRVCVGCHAPASGQGGMAGNPHASEVVGPACSKDIKKHIDL